MLDITVDEENKIILIGRFSAASTEAAEKVFNSVSTNCSVDFTGLEYISSSGIGILLKTYSRLRDSGCTIRLLNLNEHIYEVIRFSGLDKVFTIE